MRTNEKTVEYYNAIPVSIGFQLGDQSRTVILVFLNDDVLKEFRGSDGWKVGVSGSVALENFGTGDSLDTGSV